MGDDLREYREQYEHDLDDWAEARTARATDMKALAGDPWPQADRDARVNAGRPCLTYDELGQHVNQIVNDFRANPLSVLFAPGPPVTADPKAVEQSEKAAELYGDAMREMEYRCNGPEVYTTAAENAVTGGYGWARLVSEYIPGTRDQRLALKAVPDPNTIVPNWDFQKSDASDMRRCFVLERRPIPDFKRDFPKAKVTDFGGYVNDTSYSNWLDDGKILLAEAWRVNQVPVKRLQVQLPAIVPPSGVYGFRPAQAPPPLIIKEEQWKQLPEGAKVIQAWEETEPKVTQCLINGVEILDETSWPGPYIPIAGCMGRILYLDDEKGGATKRLLLSAIRLALDPYLAYCVYRTSELENVLMTTKNPYWAYEGQITPESAQEIAKSMHEPVAVLYAKATTTATGQQLLPLPQRNQLDVPIQSLSVAAEEARRGVLSALGESALPTSAQRQNEKSRVALDKIEQSRQKGTYHFFDHYKGMIGHLGRCFEAAFDTFHDTSRQIPVRMRDETAGHQWINTPNQPDAIDVKGSFAVTVSSGPNVDSTREAASEFADNLLGAEPLMALLGPQTARQLAAMAIKLKVKQTGIGAIGEEIVKIVDPPKQGDELTPEQLQQQVQELQGQLQQAQQVLQQAAQERQAKVVEKTIDGKIKYSIAKLQEDNDNLRSREDNEVRLAVAELGAKMERMALFLEERARVGTQQHEMGMAAADAAHDHAMAERTALTTLAGQSANGDGAEATNA